MRCISHRLNSYSVDNFTSEAYRSRGFRFKNIKRIPCFHIENCISFRGTGRINMSLCAQKKGSRVQNENATHAGELQNRKAKS